MTQQIVIIFVELTFYAALSAKIKCQGNAALSADEYSPVEALQGALGKLLHILQARHAAVHADSTQHSGALAVEQADHAPDQVALQPHQQLHRVLQQGSGKLVDACYFGSQIPGNIHT